MLLKVFREAKVEYLKSRTEFSIGGVSVTVEMDEKTLAEKKSKIIELFIGM